jgi:acyl carrier protein
MNHGDSPLSERTLALLRVVGRTPPTADTPLALASLEVIQLVDAIEGALDLVVPADDITRANFDTAAAIEALLTALEAGGGQR